HIEGGKGMTSKVVKFQLRADPLGAVIQTRRVARIELFAKCGICVARLDCPGFRAKSAQSGLQASLGRKRIMKKLSALYLALFVGTTMLTMPTALIAQQGAPAVTVGESDLGGVVTSPNGPEAGVWVIAETRA